MLSIGFSNALHKKVVFQSFNTKNIYLITCKGHDTVVSLSAGDDKRPAEA